MKYKTGDEGIWNSVGKFGRADYTCKIISVNKVNDLYQEYTLFFKNVETGKIITGTYSELTLDRCFTKYSKLQKAMS